MTCSVEGCDRTDIKDKGRRLCGMHRRRFDRYGDPTMTKHMTLGPGPHCKASKCYLTPERDGFCSEHYWTVHVWPLPVVLSQPYPDWHLEAACRDSDSPDDWFPGTDHVIPPPHVIQACASCPVRGECAVSGLMEDYGIFGGLSGNERRRIRKRYECGTPAGYKRHRKRGEDACGACKQANALAKRERSAA